MTHASHPLSRWLRSRQLLTDSGYGVATHQTYPFFAIEKITTDIFTLSAIMPPCADDQLTIALEKMDLIITAVEKNNPNHITCEHRFRLSAPCTIAGANWDHGNLFIELICQDISAASSMDKTPNQLVAKYSGHGSWLMQQDKNVGVAIRAA